MSRDTAKDYLARLFAVCLLALTVASCSLLTAKNLRTVLDVVQVSCIIANATLPDDRVRQACDVADDLVPAMRDVLGEQRAALRRFAAENYGACGAADASADAP